MAMNIETAHLDGFCSVFVQICTEKLLLGLGETFNIPINNGHTYFCVEMFIQQ